MESNHLFFSCYDLINKRFFVPNEFSNERISMQQILVELQHLFIYIFCYFLLFADLRNWHKKVLHGRNIYMW